MSFGDFSARYQKIASAVGGIRFELGCFTSIGNKADDDAKETTLNELFGGWAFMDISTVIIGRPVSICKSGSSTAGSSTNAICWSMSDEGVGGSADYYQFIVFGI